MQRFTDLKVWQRSHALTLEIYELTKSFPTEERFGLVSQLRRAAASVPTNITEGSKRQSNPDYARFLNIAEGSLAETEYLMLLSCDLGYLKATASEHPLAEIADIAAAVTALLNFTIFEHPKLFKILTDAQAGGRSIGMD